MDDIGILYERLDADEIRERFPRLDPGRYWPPKRIDDPAFADDASGELGGFYSPGSGFIDDPMLAAHNLASAARQHGATFRFHEKVVGVDQERRPRSAA